MRGHLGGGGGFIIKGRPRVPHLRTQDGVGLGETQSHEAHILMLSNFYFLKIFLKDGMH